jgi:hypothetical protein
MDGGVAFRSSCRLAIGKNYSTLPRRSGELATGYRLVKEGGKIDSFSSARATNAFRRRDVRQQSRSPFARKNPGPVLCPRGTQNT